MTAIRRSILRPHCFADSEIQPLSSCHQSVQSNNRRFPVYIRPVFRKAEGFVYNASDEGYPLAFISAADTLGARSQERGVSETLLLIPIVVTLGAFQ